MSHHFDTPTARDDPRINVCDFYLFPGAPGCTVMAMTVNPDAGISAPDTFRDEALYAFRFDLNADGCEDVTFKVRFDAPGHARATNTFMCSFSRFAERSASTLAKEQRALSWRRERPAVS